MLVVRLRIVPRESPAPSAIFPMPISLDDYFTERNQAISNSKVSDFLKSREYFYFKHVKRALDENLTPSMQLGKMVDAAFTAGTSEAIRLNWAVKVLKKDDPDMFATQKRIPSENLVTEAVWTKAIGMAESLLREPFYADYASMKTVESQTPLSGTLTLPGQRMSVPICSLPDKRVFAQDGTIFIDDLKTSANSAMRSNDSWYWHCEEYGYFRQLAVSLFLTRSQFPKANVVCRHIVIGSTQQGRFPIKLFVLPSELLKPALMDFAEAAYAIQELRMKNDPEAWKDDPIAWDRAAVLKLPEKLQPAASAESEEA